MTGILLAAVLSFTPSPTPGAINTCTVARVTQVHTCACQVGPPVCACPWDVRAVTCIVSGATATYPDILPAEAAWICIRANLPGTGSSVCGEPVTR